MTDVSEMLARLVAIEEIKNLRINHSYFTDTEEFDKLMDLFTEDCVCDYGMGEWTGKTALREGLSKVLKPYYADRPDAPPFLHVIANHWVELTGPSSARGRCYLVDYTFPTGGSAPLHLIAFYEDEYRHSEGRWRISRSRMDYLWRNKP